MVDKYFAQEPWEKYYTIASYEIKRIAEYTRLSFKQVMELPWGAFLIYRRDSWIDAMQRTESGRKVLKDIWRLSQTDADVAAIRAFNQRGGH